MGKKHLVGLQLFLSELGDWVGGSGGQAHHPAVGRGDAEGQVLVLAVHVHRPQLRVGHHHAGARPDDEPGVVDQSGDGVVDRSDLDLQRGGNTDLVLVRPVEPLGPGHQDEGVQTGVAPVVNILEGGVLGRDIQGKLNKECSEE